MIIAILEDRKGFKKSVNIPKFKPNIMIPDYPEKTVEPILVDGGVQPTIKALRFRFHKWLEEGEVALYREI